VLNLNSTKTSPQFHRGQVKAVNILTSMAATALERRVSFSADESREEKYRTIF